MIGSSRKATVIEVIPSYSGKDSWGHVKHYVGYVRAVDERGDRHIFINGSMNGVSGAAVGDHGTVTFVKGGFYSLWFWEGKK